MEVLRQCGDGNPVGKKHMETLWVACIRKSYDDVGIELQARGQRELEIPKQRESWRRQDPPAGLYASRKYGVSLGLCDQARQ